MSTAMMMMGITFGIAGVVQSYVERVLGMGYMTAQSYMRLWMGVTFVLGFFFLAGVITTVTDLFYMKHGQVPDTKSGYQGRREVYGGKI